MIKFEDLQFEHISIEEIKAYLEPLFDKLTKADSADEYLDMSMEEPLHFVFCSFRQK